MQKIPTLFRRDPDDMRRVLPEVTPGCEWVIEGEGTPTRKYDGTCVMLDENGGWWARREVKIHQQLPKVFMLVNTDPVTKKVIGWVPMQESGFAKWHQAALEDQPAEYAPGTYELCGPKVNRNPEEFPGHILISHSLAVPFPPAFPRGFDGLREALSDPDFDYEGVVWHHPDGRMAKLKRRDFR